jgi:hypothetical protein
MDDELRDTLAESLASGLTPHSSIEIDRRGPFTITITTRVGFDDLATAEDVADTLWTRVQDLEAIAAGWPV